MVPEMSKRFTLECRSEAGAGAAKAAEPVTAALAMSVRHVRYRVTAGSAQQDIGELLGTVPVLILAVAKGLRSIMVERPHWTSTNQLRAVPFDRGVILP
jgi:hypothetical protein